MRLLLASSLGRALIGLTVLLALGTGIGLIVLWPSGEIDAQLGQGLAAPSERADVERVTPYPCSGAQTDTCKTVEVRLLTGANEGTATSFELGAGGVNPELEPGDQVRVVENYAPPGTDQAADPTYSLTDFERRSPMLWLVMMFVALVVVFGRLRGALALLGLGLSLVVVLFFLVPAILHGESPLAVAVVGALAVMFVTIPLAHGLGPKSLAAMLGTTVSLLLIVALALTFTELTHLTGLSSEEATILQVNETGISLQGLLLAGMVIGALGVLDDMTISQASAVIGLRAANPAQSFGEIYGRAVRIGRDHVSATVNTLVLAYIGASLPALLIFASGEIGFLDAVNVELVAKEVVATLVGSIGLIAAVPVTTAIAATLSAHVEPSDLIQGATAHAH